MKDVVSDYVGIIENEVRLFSLRNELEYKGFIFDEKTNEEIISIKFKGFDAYIYVGDNLTYGYPLFEDTQDLTGYSILTRFKFDFSSYYFSPYDIHNVINSKDFETLDFHNLQDEEDVLKAIKTLLDFIEKNLAAIKDISANLILQKQLKDNYEHDLSVVSERITAEKLKENFRKYSEKHENNLYFLGYANLTYNFAKTDKYRELDKYFKRKSKKGKLIVFEQRLYEHLKNNGYEPVSEKTKINTEKQFKKIRRSLWIEIPAYIIGGILAIVTLVAVEELTAATLPDGLYRLLGIGESSEFSFFIFLICYRYFLIRIFEALFAKKVYSSEKDKKAEKTATAVLTVICLIAIILCTSYNYFFKVCTVALHDSGIYVGTQAKNEILPFENDRVEFFIIEGYTDGENGTYYDSHENKELYLTVDKDYEGYIIGVYDTPEELSALINLLKEKGVDIISVKDYEAFSDNYIYGE
ncbi:MAG: hypothetical protein IJO73_01335 [Clostridia bacterium]|nr:hypothetical protein [Clostridia bacterium]